MVSLCKSPCLPLTLCARSYCVERATGIGCWDDGVKWFPSQVFRNVYSGQPYSYLDCITQHPLKTNMIEYHQNLSTLISVGLTN